MPGRPAPVEVRFWSKVKKADGDACWEWQGSVPSHGYGQFDYRFACRAHRAAWILTYGDIPQGVKVLHTCDNKRCVRPSHLFLGTQKDNVVDCIQKGRISRGEHRPQHKLTEAQVREIRNRHAARAGTYRGMAAEYGVQYSYIWKIIRRTAWRHVQ